MAEIGGNDQDWLSKFFSGENSIRWEDLISNTAPDDWGDDIFPWLNLLERGQADTPICLPCLYGNQKVKWYAGAKSIQGAHAVLDELKAFIGNSFPDLDVRPYQLDSNNIVENALSEVFSNPLFTITGHTVTDVINIRRKLSLYQSLVIRRPSIKRNIARPFGIIRGEFDRALLAGNEKDARSFLGEMKKTGRLNSENLIFLEVRLLAGLGLWQQIVLKDNLLRDLADFPLPPKVIQDVSEAHYRIFIEPYEASGDVENCLEELKDTSVNRLGPIFGRRHGIETPTVLKFFLFYELLRPDSNKIYARELLTKLSKQETNLLLERVEGILSPRDTKTDKPDHEEKQNPSLVSTIWQEAEEAFEYSDFDRAFILYSKMPVTAKSLQKMAMCAIIDGDEKAILGVIQGYENLPHDEIDKLEETVVKLIGRLRDILDADPISQIVDVKSSETDSPEALGWMAWGEWVAAGASIGACEQVLEQNSQSWPVEEITRSYENSERFANLVGNADGEVEVIFRTCFPTLFNAFVIDVEEPSANLKPLYKNILFLIVTSDAISINDLEISSQLINFLLSFGLSGEEYSDLLVQISDLLEGQGSPSTFNWALDIAETLSLHRSSDDEARLRFVSTISELAQHFLHRLNASHRGSLALLYKDFQMELPEVFSMSPENAPVEEELDLAKRLAGKKIGIYTLTEQAGIRAKKVIKDIAPDSNVVLNKDKFCTEQLLFLAKSADIFVFAWKSSKHQAFYCVKNNRPPDMPFLQPIGKGSSSIIKEILDYS